MLKLQRFHRHFHVPLFLFSSPVKSKNLFIVSLPAIFFLFFFFVDWRNDKIHKRAILYIIKGFRTIVFIFIVISTTFRPRCPPAFFRCLSNSGTCTELQTTSFIESTVVACSDSVSHNRVQVLSIPVLLLPCSED